MTAFLLAIGFGPWEIGLILVAVLVLFGGSRIPSLARNLGSGIVEFKRGLKGGDEDSSASGGAPGSSTDAPSASSKQDV